MVFHSLFHVLKEENENYLIFNINVNYMVCYFDYIIVFLSRVYFHMDFVEVYVLDLNVNNIDLIGFLKPYKELSDGDFIFQVVDDYISNNKIHKN